jgi:hypothetical protein
MLVVKWWWRGQPNKRNDTSAAMVKMPLQQEQICQRSNGKDAIATRADMLVQWGQQCHRDTIGKDASATSATTPL